MSFADIYGPWALVTGAASGIGRAFAHALARRGVSVLALDASEAVTALADELRTRHGVGARALVCDLRDAKLGELLDGATGDLDFGMLVANAAMSKVGPFVEQELSDMLDALDTNCRATLLLTHRFAGRLAQRGRGGLVLLSSMSALWGTPLFANYAATKAYNMALAEALWDELAPLGIHVLGVCPGPTDTPGLRNVTPRALPASVPVSSAEQVAEESLAQLGKGPLCIPGWKNRIISAVMSRLLPRSTVVRLNGVQTRRVWGAADA
jgi:short-subunit dehydrogenase